MLALTPAQWLPKPATSWLPHIMKPLRGTWSPEGREKRGPSRVRSWRCIGLAPLLEGTKAELAGLLQNGQMCYYRRGYADE